MTKQTKMLVVVETPCVIEAKVGHPIVSMDLGPLDPNRLLGHMIHSHRHDCARYLNELGEVVSRDRFDQPIIRVPADTILSVIDEENYWRYILAEMILEKIINVYRVGTVYCYFYNY